VRGDLIRILNKLLRRRNKFDYIMIETTGLANPAPVIQVMKQRQQAPARLQQCSCVFLLGGGGSWQRQAGLRRGAQAELGVA
jgi:G3E family GTPase